jgi:hypothetical protein
VFLASVGRILIVSVYPPTIVEMKYSLVFAALFICSSLNAQKLKAYLVPKAVQSSLKNSYPEVTKVSWIKEAEGYEAEFHHKGNETSALFDAAGYLLEEEREIGRSKLPQAVREAIAKDFVGYRICEAAIITVKGVTTYEAEVKKRKEHFEATYDLVGKLIKKDSYSHPDKD